jgi:hypothetical protein
MRWLKRVISLALLLAAAVVALVTGFSDHNDDYGQVPLAQGGVLHLPEGEATVFLHQPGNTDAIAQANVPIAFQIVSQSGVPVAMSEPNGTPIDGASVSRSETIGELGAITKLDVPASGTYTVNVAAANLAPGTTLEFGTNAGAALASKWKLFVALIVGAFLVGLIPVPKPKRRWDDEAGPPSGWSSDPRAPYAG